MTSSCPTRDPPTAYRNILLVKNPRDNTDLVCTDMRGQRTCNHKLSMPLCFPTNQPLAKPPSHRKMWPHHRPGCQVPALKAADRKKMGTH